MHLRLLHETQIGLKTNEEWLRHGSERDLSMSIMTMTLTMMR